MTKAYLGDGVYADFDGWCVILTTEDGTRATNTIFLEPEVLERFKNYSQLEKLVAMAHHLRRVWGEEFGIK